MKFTDKPRSAGGQRQPQPQTGRPWRPGTPEPEWTVDPLRKAQLLHLARQVIDRMPEVRAEKVAALKERLQQGAYPIDARKLTGIILPGPLVFSDRQQHPLDYLDLGDLLAHYPFLVPEYLALKKRNPFHWQDSINVLLRSLESRDRYTGRHSVRVTAIALSFAEHLRLPPADRKFLQTAGYLHDIGKAVISLDVLLKTGTLTKEERACIKAHPPLGREILEPLGLRPQEEEIILHHHERWDGKGYPHGLAGEKIPFSCRLLSLADVFEALTSDRPHRPRKPLALALALIQAMAGTQFDPRLAWEFIKVASFARI